MKELKLLNVAPEVEEDPLELSPLEQKKLQKQQEKEEEARKKYAMTMVTRAEAYQISQETAVHISRQTAKEATEFVREPLMSNIAQTMALSELLLKKGIITQEELQESLDEVYDKLYPLTEGQPADDKIEFVNEGNEEERYATQEAQEQPSEG